MRTWRTGFKKCLDSRSTRITTTQILNRPIRLIFSAAKAIVAHSTHIGRWLFTSQNRETIFRDITTLTWKTVKDFKTKGNEFTNILQEISHCVWMVMGRQKR